MKYRSNEKVFSGLPLGGIGTGKIEILPSGGLSSITFQNNWNAPIIENDVSQDGLNGLPGFHFALCIEENKSRRIIILQTDKINKFESIDKIEFEGKWPQAKLKYFKKNLNLEVTLTASGGIRPNDMKTSMTPGALFRFEIKNKSKKELKVSVISIIRNLVGIDEIGRRNRITKCSNYLNLICDTANPYPLDVTAGEYSITVRRDKNTTFLGQWNLQTTNWKFTPDTISMQALDIMKEKGALPNLCETKPQRGGGAKWGGAISSSKILKSGETKKWDFALAWHYPVHHAGHIYENYFSSSVSAGKTIIKNADVFYNSLKEWKKSAQSSRFPEWLSDALLNNLYVLTSTTWWDRQNNFAFYEAPVICPLMGTLDVRYYATVPFVRFFPLLEKSELKLFSKAMREDGYIPHDLGRNRIDNPNDGTTHYPWKDLNPKFVLQIYRDVIWLNDKKYLKEMYPFAKQAMFWSMKTDKNGDGLPDNEGADQTYDVWEFYGTGSYTSSIYLAALLAMEKLAKLVKDKNTATSCRNAFEKGQKSFIDELWNGKYFVAAWSNGETYPTSIAGQLNGEWYARLLGLESIVPREYVKKAVKSLIELNGKASRYGVANSVYPDGKIDNSNAHSANIWPGESYAVAALAIYEGFVKEGLEIAKKTWENIYKIQKNPWNQPDVIDSASGKFGFGDYYMRNMAIWAVAEAMKQKQHPLQVPINRQPAVCWELRVNAVKSDYKTSI